MMRTKITAGVLALAIAAVAASATTADAQRWRHRHHGGWGWGAGAGFAAGALLGGALASRPYYGSRYYYNDPGYYAAVPGPSGSADAYCAQRFKSYDPASGTYLGYDGIRHPCP
jgi:MFS family permease